MQKKGCIRLGDLWDQWFVFLMQSAWHCQLLLLPSQDRQTHKTPIFYHESNILPPEEVGPAWPWEKGWAFKSNAFSWMRNSLHCTYFSHFNLGWWKNCLNGSMLRFLRTCGLGASKRGFSEMKKLKSPVAISLLLEGKTSEAARPPPWAQGQMQRTAPWDGSSPEGLCHLPTIPSRSLSFSIPSSSQMNSQQVNESILLLSS